MKSGPGHAVRTVAVVGLLVLAGCSGDGDVTSLGPVPTGPSTTVEATTTTTTPATTSTSSVPVTTSTTRVRPTTTRPPATTAPTPVTNGLPQVTASPSRAAVGARVRIEGTGFTDEHWMPSGASLWLAARSGCGAFAEAQHTVSVTAAGRLTGEFVVPATGACRQSDGADVPVTPGTYDIVFACTPCSIGRFEVT